MDHLTVACWFWEKGCRLDIDWAAWVQAVFTILALFITQRIASASERNRRDEILMAANTFASQLIACIATLKQFCEQNRRLDVMTHAYVLHEITLLGHSIPIELLHADSGFTFFRLRAICAEATAMIEEIRYLPDNNDITGFRDRFEGLRSRAHNESVSMNGH